MDILQQLTETTQENIDEEELQFDEGIVNTEPAEIELVEEEGEPLYCSHCDWKTHANAKNKPDEYKAEYGKNSTKKYTKKTKQKIIIAPPRIVEELDKITENIEVLDEESIRQKLLGDLDLLQIKFSQIDFTWNYNISSSLKHLRRQKSLFLRVLNDAASTEAVFNLLVVASKGVERIGDISGMADIEGYSSDIKDNKDEIYPILQNMVDSGTLDVSHLTPELRLGMIMASTLVGRLEKNRIIKKGNLNDSEEEEGLEYV